MNAMLKLPPSGRDWDVYRGVRVEERTTREVAAEFHLSQTRVCQIVERVAKFLLEVTPEGTDEQRGKRANLAEQIAAERVQFLLKQAVRSYDASKGEQTTTRIAQDAAGANRVVTTVRMNYGEPRFLDVAARLAILGGKLPCSTLSQHVVYEEEGAEEPAASVQEPAAESGARSDDAPAKEDCSSLGAKPVVEEPERSRHEDLSANDAKECVQGTSPAERINIGKARPVQTPSAATKQNARRRAFFAAAG